MVSLRGVLDVVAVTVQLSGEAGLGCSRSSFKNEIVNEYMAK